MMNFDLNGLQYGPKLRIDIHWQAVEEARSKIMASRFWPVYKFSLILCVNPRNNPHSLSYRQGRAYSIIGRMQLIERHRYEEMLLPAGNLNEILAFIKSHAV